MKATDQNLPFDEDLGTYPPLLCPHCGTWLDDIGDLVAAPNQHLKCESCSINRGYPVKWTYDFVKSHPYTPSGYRSVPVLDLERACNALEIGMACAKAWMAEMGHGLPAFIRDHTAEQVEEMRSVQEMLKP